MIKYPTLYSRTATGAVQVWFMEREGNSYRSTSGQIDGAKVVSEWTQAFGKNIGKANATTDEQQADAEVMSKYKKQIKSGGYWENISDIDKQKFFQVMLAKKLADYINKIDWSKGVAVQIKYNGERVHINSKGAWSRKGELQMCIPHIINALQPFFAKFPDAVLDGEGFNYDRRERLNEIRSLMGKKKPTVEDLKLSKDLIRFYCYDGFGFPPGRGDNCTTSMDGYLLRKRAIDNAFFAPCFADRYARIICEVPTWIVHSKAELDKLYEKFLADNQEGAIIRILGQPYENKRSKYLLKYKPVDDEEFKIVSVQEGVGKFAGRVATFTCENLDGSPFADGETSFNATFKGEEVDAIKAWKSGEAQAMVGKIATILFNGRTGYGKPNYPRLDWYNWRKHD
jgi:DNA ligase 1